MKYANTIPDHWKKRQKKLFDDIKKEREAFYKKYRPVKKTIR